jgi:hypothetical protein
MSMKNLSDVVAAMRKLKGRWCDPEVIIPFLDAAFPILEDTEAKMVLAMEKLDKLGKDIARIAEDRQRR